MWRSMLRRYLIKGMLRNLLRANLGSRNKSFPNTLRQPNCVLGVKMAVPAASPICSWWWNYCHKRCRTPSVLLRQLGKSNFDNIKQLSLSSVLPQFRASHMAYQQSWIMTESLDTMRNLALGNDILGDGPYRITMIRMRTFQIRSFRIMDISHDRRFA